MLRQVPLLLSLCLFGCMPQSGGPSPRAVLVSPSQDYAVEKILEPLASLGTLLGSRIDKKLETIIVGGNAMSRFSQYELAYWYPHEGSDIYGVAVIRWDSKLHGPDADTIVNRYFVEVYAPDAECSLCQAVRNAERHILFSM
jgi:hypothetical protein